MLTFSESIIILKKETTITVLLKFCNIPAHIYLNTVGNGKRIVEVYSFGKTFSDVTLKIDPAAKDIVSKTASVKKVYQDAMKPDPIITKLVNIYDAKVTPEVNQIVGNSGKEYLAAAANR